MKRLLAVLLVLLMTAGAVEVGAVAPSTMSYQGVLNDGAGNALSGTHTVSFRLYTALGGGSPLWSESQSVTLDRGGFSVILGSITPLNLAFDQPYFLGVAVDGAAELSPRAALASAPYSLSLRLPFYQAISSGSAGFTLYNSTGDAIIGQSNLSARSGVSGFNNQSGGIGVTGTVGDQGIGVDGYSPNRYGIHGATQSGSAVYGEASGAGDGGYFFSTSGTGLSGTSTGVTGIFGSTTNFSTGSVAILARNSGAGYGLAATGPNIGAYAAQSSGSNAAYLGSQCCAADLYGTVNVHGTLTKSAGSFRIDHPLDPTGKYLSHSFVESPDMMNIYNGNVALDGSGQAWVELPAWFEALNMDFRYQLTAIGAPGPNLYVAQEIVDNRFRVAGGAPGGRVSWQVTGVRHDKYAEMHRIPVEEEKSGPERGRYIHPDLYGAGDEQGLERAMHPEAREVLVAGEASARAIPAKAASSVRDRIPAAADAQK